jgi:hypothetical protein
VAVLTLGSCADAGGRPEAWPAPPDPAARARAAGLQLYDREHLATHRHTHLDVFVDGVRVDVPAAIGIDTTVRGVRRFDDPSGVSYGGIERCDEPCISPLHTHDGTGMIHTESAGEELLTLGQFFTEWDVELPEDDIEVYLDGVRNDADPACIRLTDRLQIAVVIGSPPKSIPDDADFSQA